MLVGPDAHAADVCVCVCGHTAQKGRMECWVAAKIVRSVDLFPMKGLARGIFHRSLASFSILYIFGNGTVWSVCS